MYWIQLKLNASLILTLQTEEETDSYPTPEAETDSVEVEIDLDEVLDIEDENIRKKFIRDILHDSKSSRETVNVSLDLSNIIFVKTYIFRISWMIFLRERGLCKRDESAIVRTEGWELRVQLVTHRQWQLLLVSTVRSQDNRNRH